MSHVPFLWENATKVSHWLNEWEDHEYIREDKFSNGMRHFGVTQKQNHEDLCPKWIISHTIVEIYVMVPFTSLIPN